MTIVFFLEEPSAKTMLEGLLPRILPQGVHCRYIVFQGKQDLERNLVRKLRGWQLPKSLFVVMRDQDSGNCLNIKMKLTALCHDAGRDKALVRIACRELESFYLGDLAAVEQGLGIPGLARMQERRKFRSPDSLVSPARELASLTGGRYQKIAGSRAIAPHLNPKTNASHSFRVLVEGICRLAGASSSR